MFDKDIILELLKAKGWSKYRLSKEANIPQSSLHDILSGKIKNPTADRLGKIASALGVSVDIFFSYKKEDDDSNKYNYNKSDDSDDIKYIPLKFTDSKEARNYICHHKVILDKTGIDIRNMSDDEIVSFANDAIKLIELASYKYKKQ